MSSPPDKRNARPGQDARSQVVARSGFTRHHYVAGCARRQDAPSTFGLTAAEIWREAARLVFDQGWSLDEVRSVLSLPASVIA